MVLADDLVIGASAAVIAAALVILAVTLSRYRTVVADASKSAALAKDLWDSMSSRLSVQDARIIDLMAKVEVYSVRKTPFASRPQPAAIQSPSTGASLPKAAETPTPPVVTPVADQASTQRELQILNVLASGPKSSSEIRQIISKSREHTARLMKGLFDEGLVVRNDQNKPYVYEITEAGRRYLTGSA